MPSMKAIGMNTATIDMVVANTAIPISRVPSRAAVILSLPISIWRTIFSRTTMASSINTPMASERPNNDMKFRVKPQAQTAINDARTEVGNARDVINVERHEFKKIKTTTMVNKAPSPNASVTLRILAATSSP